MNKAGFIEYKMTSKMADFYIKAAKGLDEKMAKGNPNAYLCKVVNEQFGLMGLCTNVIVED